MTNGTRVWLALAASLVASLAAPVAAFAHEVPEDVRVAVFLKPEGNRMRILVRVPTNALIDVLFPLQLGDVFLDLPQSEPLLPTAAKLWVSDLLNIYEDDRELARPTVLRTLLSANTDPSFNTWTTALAHVTGPPLPPTARLAWDRSTMDVLLEAPIQSARSDFSFVPKFARIGVKVTTTLHFLPPNEPERVFVYESDPAMFHMNPTWSEAAAHFLQAGFAHILSETDHLVLLFALVVLYHRPRALVPFIIAFTIAHSITLAASWLNSKFQLVTDAQWFAPLIGALMAISIIYVALDCVVENAVGMHTGARRGVAVAAGAVFGCGFWFYLEPILQYGGGHPAISVLSFNAGIEMGQLLALALLVPAVHLIFRFVFFGRVGVILLAALAAHLEWHRMVGRAFALSRYPVPWSASDALVTLLLVLLAGCASLMLTRRRLQPQNS